ncbi:unnamed protein product [Bursaphelenchus xylophilus]|uniref:(pine wood nematode) hypothetical protein n=1 Tax=Bursaphelenchus xylophilus TaxID=6326 RepID=A0A1I7SME4_BURXY|nr:unnamed protein product [Bursaphelenchus xylophilus]CAG9130150.1 unnamed protein product [Bursaphelenchus xylophilus]
MSSPKSRLESRAITEWPDFLIECALLAFARAASASSEGKGWHHWTFECGGQKRPRQSDHVVAFFRTVPTANSGSLPRSLLSLHASKECGVGLIGTAAFGIGLGKKGERRRRFARPLLYKNACGICFLSARRQLEDRSGHILAKGYRTTI